MKDNKQGELTKTTDLKRPYALCGRRCYAIGTQDSFWPDVGWHTFNEMGGIWTHPIKVADGIWIGFNQIDEGCEGFNPMRRGWLRECDEFVVGDWGAWVDHKWENIREQTNWGITGKLAVERRMFTCKDEPAMGTEVHVTSKPGGPKELLMYVLTRYDIIPTWCSGWPDPISLEAETVDGVVVVHGVTNNDLPFAYGKWTAAMAFDTPVSRVAIGDDIWGWERTTGKGMSVLAKIPIKLEPDATVRFVIAGDHTGEKGAIETATKVLNGYDKYFDEKVGWYKKIAEEMTVVETPEKLLNDGYSWGKMNLEWLTQTSPIIGTGAYAGLQDYAQYFTGDTVVSIAGMLNCGLHETAKDAIRMLAMIMEKNDWRAVHAFVSTGNIYDPGSVGETPLFAYYVWETYKWTGDEEFLKEMYPVCKKGLFDYLLKLPTRDDIILVDFEDKPDSAVDAGCPTHMAMGFLAMRQMAERMQEWDIVGKAGAQTLRFKNQIEEIFWVDEFGSYAGMVDEKLKPQISDFEKEKGEFNHMPSVYLAHSRAGEKSRMVSALKRVDRPMSSNELGVFLGISNPDEGGFMPYSTNMAAVGAFNYGEQEQGLRFLRGTAKCLGHIMPGALPETVASDGDPNKFNLYESSHWEFLQLWSAALYCEGLVWGLLRVEPDASWGKVKMTPKLPEGWPYAEIKNLRIGQTRLSVRIDKGNKATVTHIDGPELEVIIQDANDETVYASTFEG